MATNQKALAYIKISDTNVSLFCDIPIFCFLNHRIDKSFFAIKFYFSTPHILILNYFFIFAKHSSLYMENLVKVLVN